MSSILFLNAHVFRVWCRFFSSQLLYILFKHILKKILLFLSQLDNVTIDDNVDDVLLDVDDVVGGGVGLFSGSVRVERVRHFRIPLPEQRRPRDTLLADGPLV